MGPSVKFVLVIIDAFSTKKMGVNFFPEKKDLTRGGSEGGKRPNFSPFFNPSLKGSVLMSTTFLLRASCSRGLSEIIFHFKKGRHLREA